MAVSFRLVENMKKLVDGTNTPINGDFESIKEAVLRQGCVQTVEDRIIGVAKEECPEVDGGFIFTVNDDRTFSSIEFDNVDKAVKKFLSKVR